MVRFGRVQKAFALLPLAVLSAAWTAGLTHTDSDASASPAQQTLPDGTRVPTDAVRAPASLTAPRALGPGVAGHAHEVLSTASASGIPAVALVAYQRAATIIDAADRTCHLPWELTAAIGRVESDHGRVNGNVLTAKGIARPGIFGPALDGGHGTTLIKDTDAGQYDDDATYDRAVGPMQFIPSTWAIVGVDADNDGQRNPQDVYDAALASAVYLCSGPDDLSTDAGQRSAVFRYNHSQKYVALVLAIEHAYQRGDFSAVPNGTTSASFPFGAPPVVGNVAHPHTRPAGHHPHQATGTPPASTPTSGPTHGPTTGPTANPTGHPTANPSANPTGGLPTLLPSQLPTLPTDLPTLLTRAEAIVQCLAKGLIDNPLDPNDAFDKCVFNLTH